MVNGHESHLAVGTTLEQNASLSSVEVENAAIKKPNAVHVVAVKHAAADALGRAFVLNVLLQGTKLQSCMLSAAQAELHHACTRHRNTREAEVIDQIGGSLLVDGIANFDASLQFGSVGLFIFERLEDILDVGLFCVVTVVFAESLEVGATHSSAAGSSQ